MIIQSIVKRIKYLIYTHELPKMSHSFQIIRLDTGIMNQSLSKPFIRHA